MHYKCDYRANTVLGILIMYIIIWLHVYCPRCISLSRFVCYLQWQLHCLFSDIGMTVNQLILLSDWIASSICYTNLRVL